MKKDNNIQNNLYKHSAEAGLGFGVLLSVVSLSFIYSSESAILSLIAILLLMALPVVLYALQHRFVTRSSAPAEISSLWMLGLMISLFGSLICGVVTYVWLQYVEPTFISDQAQAAVDAYKTIPEMQGSELVTTMQRAIDEGLLPSAIEFVINMILLTTFLGSIVSLITACIARTVCKKNRVTPDNKQ